MEEVVAQRDSGNTRSFYKAFHQYEGLPLRGFEEADSRMDR